MLPISAPCSLIQRLVLITGFGPTYPQILEYWTMLKVVEPDANFRFKYLVGGDGDDGG